jgi:hypothetical protein
VKTNGLAGFYFIVDVSLTGTVISDQDYGEMGIFLFCDFRSATFWAISFLMSLETFLPSIKVKGA